MFEKANGLTGILFAILVCAVLMSATLPVYGNEKSEENMTQTSDLEINHQNNSVRDLPPIDTAPHDQIQRATFALG